MKKRLVSRTAIVAVVLAFFSVFALVRRPSETSRKSVAGAGYIKYVEFNVTAKAMNDAMKIDIDTYGGENHVSWVDLLALCGASYGGDFKRYSVKNLNEYAEKLKSGQKAEEITKSKYFSYYKEAYEAVLGGMLGTYEQNGEQKYGLKAFSPIADGYYYNHFDDFGAARSFGYRREHLGHDLMGSVGTPVVAVESGYVEALGWNVYGGWRIGIRSFDGKRYYYYAHLRKNHPYADIAQGDIITAGSVIGYLGMTGYSTKENTNNINVPHLHYGLQLIFDPSQKDGYNQIWIDMYELTKFLYQNRAIVRKDGTSGEFVSQNGLIDYDVPD